ncbi:MAG: SLBB domain-containing protein, partial [Dysgonamonadaceae bacterium]|nr:SLBB domain-containing protein [Dysgonamonadaceae bacterium]
QYVKQEHSKGTSQEQIATDLIKQGVSRSQLERIKNQYESGQLNEVSSEKSSAVIHRERQTDPESEINAGELDVVSTEMSPANTSSAGQIFGRNIFNTRNLSFNPNTNIPTPVDYRLGPGDEVIIDIWGASQASVRQTISPEGSIMVDRLGPIYLNGLTIKEANAYVQRKFSDVYAGIDAGGSSQIKLSLGQIRTIQINVMGEVVTPGTYSLSSLSSVFHALYRAGGVNNIGSLRSVELYRNGKLLRTLDIYEYLMQGKLNEDIRMTDGDVVIVPPYISLVSISGNVKRPMFYEMTEKENVADLIKYAGGFTGDAYTKKIRLTRRTEGENQIFTLKEDIYQDFALRDKDIVSVSSGLELFENRAEINGAVYRSGYYEIGNNIKTIKDLILAADGVRGDAFLNRALLTREKDDYTIETLPVDVGSILSGSGQDITLRKNDILYIPSISDLKEYGDFVIHGAIARPGNYKYADNTTLEDLIVKAGGLLESASTIRVDIARRMIDPTSTTETRTLSETFSMGIKDGFVVEGDSGFVLKPYDQVYVRNSPGYQAQRNVHVNGEILFPGAYALNKKTERISDIVKRAGNITLDAYPKGARLTRVRTDSERFRSEVALRMASMGGKDSIAVNSLNLRSIYDVGIELDKALQNPGSDYDLVLRAGDVLTVPEYENTVKVNGAVMYPNTVTYKKGEKLAYYIDQAGGYSDKAKKNKTFVIYMNGTVSKVKSRNKSAIQPGCEIIVPTKEESTKLTVPEMITVGSTATSALTVVALLINALTK